MVQKYALIISGAKCLVGYFRRIVMNTVILYSFVFIPFPLQLSSILLLRPIVAPQSMNPFSFIKSQFPFTSTLSSSYLFPLDPQFAFPLSYYIRLQQILSLPGRNHETSGFFLHLINCCGFIRSSNNYRQQQLPQKIALSDNSLPSVVQLYLFCLHFSLLQAILKEFENTAIVSYCNCFT